jgi:cell division septal protein FtsQ
MRTREPVERTSRPRAVVLPFPGLDTEERAAVARLIPSGRVLLLAFAALAACLLAVVLVRQTSVFAVQRVEVTGAPPGVVREVERALAGVRGRNLLQLDTVELRDAVERIPTVRAASFDRAFPHVLSVALVAERPVAVIRQGRSSWLVSDRGRVMSEVRRDRRPGLPRIWAPRTLRLEPGVLAERELMTAVAAVAPLAAARFPARVAAVAFTDDELTLRLRSGLLVQLGEPADVRLKLAVAGRVLPLLDDDAAYLDVSVPERPVSGETLDSQVEGET